MTYPTFCTGRSERILHVCVSVECGWRCDGDRRWRTVCEDRVRPLRVVASAPLIDVHLGFQEAVEDLAIDAFIAEYAIEGLAGAIRPSRPFHVAIDHGFGDREPQQLGRLPFYF